MYMNGPEENAANIDYIEAILVEKGWRGKQECFGGNVINYGRWSDGKAPFTDLGFGVYKLEWNINFWSEELKFF